MGITESAPESRGFACFSYLNKEGCLKDRPKSPKIGEAPQIAVKQQKCSGCQTLGEECAKGSRGDLLCRRCLRQEDEALLGALTDDEQRGLNLVASILDTVSWKYWKPGVQPAKVLDWLYLGDLLEATDFDLLAKRGINAVLNLVNWWEIAGRFNDISELAALYREHGLTYMESDSEDRLFFDMVGKCWPASEAFLEECRSAGKYVLVNCKAGHNRSACIVVCWLLIHGKMTLLKALELVQLQRGTILSNHGFRLQLVRLALRLNLLGDLKTNIPSSPTHLHRVASNESEGLESIISKKRLFVKYDENSKTFPCDGWMKPRQIFLRAGNSVISDEVDKTVSQRALKVELLACLYHRGRKFVSDYEYTSSPPTVVGSGFSGDVVLCRRRERTAVQQNKETSVRCVKTFNLQDMGPFKIDKLKNEAVIYLQLEHPHIARLFDVFEDAEEVSLVMQYCSGGTLQQALQTRGKFEQAEFQETAAPMLLAINYIHRAGIVHRDIKPRNWVYEADGRTVKLIDFGFSVKGYLNEGEEGLCGCMGTLGYLAPEVVQAGTDTERVYTNKCDIWSLGVVFLELLTGQPAFHKEHGMCDGYTEECVLRDIAEITAEGIEKLLVDVPTNAAPFIRAMLSIEAIARPSARDALDHPYLASAREALLNPPKVLSLLEILDRFRANSRASKTSRAWLMAVARSPTYLPWDQFCVLRNTFKMFDARGLSGTINLETFLSVMSPIMQKPDDVDDWYWDQYSPRNHGGHSSDPMDWESVAELQVRRIWASVCGEQESLSYCEFLAILLPQIDDDVFEDVDNNILPTSDEDTRDVSPAMSSLTPGTRMSTHWDPCMPISRFLPMAQACNGAATFAIFSHSTTLGDVVRAMSNMHRRWVIIKYADGRHEFFDYMDLNHQLLKMSRARGAGKPSDVFAKMTSMPVGLIANCSGHSAYRPQSLDTPLRDVLLLISGQASNKDCALVRRVPIVNSLGDVVHVFSSTDFLKIASKFAALTAVLQSRAARAFDRRDTILDSSVPHDASMMAALNIMDSQRLTICAVTSRELSGDMGGALAINVVSVADLKLVACSGQYEALDKSMTDFVAWRLGVENRNVGQILRHQQLRRFNVVSVSANDSLHLLASRLLASKLQRIFLSSDDIQRIVGVVSSLDILVEIIDQVL